MVSGKYHPTGFQIAAARTMLALPQAELAALAQVSIATLRRMEASAGPAPGMPNNVAAVRAALEKAGIEFIDGEYIGEGGPGVRLKAAEGNDKPL